MTDYVIDGHRVIWDAAEAAALLEHDTLIAYDSETTGLSPWTSNLALMQFYGDDSGTLALIRTPHGAVPAPIRALLESGKNFIVHNGSNFDLLFLGTHGVDWKKSHWHDTLVAETLITTTGRRNVSVSLRASVKRRLGYEIDKDMEHTSWERLDSDYTYRQVEYASKDVLSLPALYRSQWEKAESTGQTDALKMEMECMPIFTQMVFNGLPMLAEQVTMFAEDQGAIAAEKQLDLIPLLGNINYGSHVQLKKALGVMGMNIESTQEDWLLEYMSECDNEEHIKTLNTLLELKHALKRSTMYDREWIEKYIVDDWVHPRFWQCSADTTRVTSSDPNLQQIPKDGRRMIGNLPGYKIVAADYSQIEVRIAAHVARDAELLKTLDEEDVHSAVAAGIFDVPISKVTKDMRKLAKASTFTLLFGGSANRLYSYAQSQGSNIDKAQAFSIRRKFFERFVGLENLIFKARRMADMQRPITIKLPNGAIRTLVGPDKTATRILNTSVQGSAAVGLKYGLLEADRRGLSKYLGTTVHDENVAAVPDAEAEDFAHELESAMVEGMHKVLPHTVLAEIKRLPNGDLPTYWLP